MDLVYSSAVSCEMEKRLTSQLTTLLSALREKLSPSALNPSNVPTDSTSIYFTVCIIYCIA